MTALNGAETKVKLSQNESLMIEGLRALGWSNDEIITRVRARELPIDDSIFQFDYSELSLFDAGQPELFETAVSDGYQMKFNTLGGIRSWISIALGKEAEVNRVPGSESVDIVLTAAEKKRLASSLSSAWIIEDAGENQEAAADSPSYCRIVPAQRVQL